MDGCCGAMSDLGVGEINSSQVLRKTLERLRLSIDRLYLQSNWNTVSRSATLFLVITGKVTGFSNFCVAS